MLYCRYVDGHTPKGGEQHPPEHLTAILRSPICLRPTKWTGLQYAKNTIKFKFRSTCETFHLKNRSQEINT